MDDGPPPPPPPPHGANSQDTSDARGGEGRKRRADGLPDGNYDIFIVPPHSSGGGFIYFPSLQPQRNSFIAGSVCTILAIGIWSMIYPVLRTWFLMVVASGGAGVGLMVACVGAFAWGIGRTSFDSFTGQSSANDKSQNSRRRRGNGGDGESTGGYSGSSSGGTGAKNYGNGFPGSNARANTGANFGYGGGPTPEPQAQPPPRSGDYGGGGYRQHHAGFESASNSPPHQPPPPQGSPPPQSSPPPPQESQKDPNEEKKRQWEKQREEIRKKNEQRKKEEEAKRRLDEYRKRKQEEADAKKKQQEQEELEKQQQREKEQKEQKDREIRERRERLQKEREERERKVREERERQIRERVEAREKELREKEEREKELRQKEAREKEAQEKAERERAEKEQQAKDEPASRMTDPPSPKKRPNNFRHATAHTEIDPEEMHSFRPYDKPKVKKAPRTVYTSTSASSFAASSYAASDSTSRTTPPPVNREGTYRSADPDAIVIKGAYAFNNANSLKPIAELIAGMGQVSAGLVLRITTEGMFIDDEGRGSPQREWDTKAWTLKLVETGDHRGLHIIRTNIRDVEGRKFVFVYTDQDKKAKDGIQRLRKGPNTRGLTVSMLDAKETKVMLERTGWV